MSARTHDTFFHWRDLSPDHFYKNKLSRFSDALKQRPLGDELPYFLFSNDIGDIEQACKAIEDIYPNENRPRQVVMVHHRNNRTGHRELWNHLGNGLYDIIEWTGEDDLIQYTYSLAERNHSINEILQSSLVRNNLIGETAIWKQFLRNVVEAAVFSDVSILLIGESGTGKELVSRLVHTIDRRPTKKELVLVDCTTVVPELAGSEFFGHEKGAYTNAIQTREGAFSLANEGTLFLDEVGELSLSLQAELMRVIQEGTYKKVGSNTWHQTKFRLVCATNKNLQDQVRKAQFRQDLYFRIADFEFYVPSLHERMEDVPLLAKHFLAEAFPEQPGLQFDDSVLEYLMKRQYTGNIRELRQLIRRIAIRHVKHKKITIGEIPIQDRIHAQQETGNGTESLRASLRKAIVSGCNLWELKTMTMEEAIRIALELSNGNKELAAQRLGVTWRAILQFRKKNGSGAQGKDDGATLQLLQ